jgi:hypothetical protein
VLEDRLRESSVELYAALEPRFHVGERGVEQRFVLVELGFEVDPNVRDLLAETGKGCFEVILEFSSEAKLELFTIHLDFSFGLLRNGRPVVGVAA